MLRILAPCSIFALLLFGLSSSALADIPPSKAEARAEAKQARKEAKAKNDKAKEDEDDQSGCSVQQDNRDVLGLAALVRSLRGRPWPDDALEVEARAGASVYTRRDAADTS